MKSLRSLINSFVVGMLFGAALAFGGFWLGANFLSPTFLQADLHEVATAVGTTGALAAMAYTLRRDRRWRIRDARAKSRIAWSAISSDVARFHISVEQVQKILKNSADRTASVDDASLLRQIETVRKSTASIRNGSAHVSLLAVGVSFRLNWALDLATEWVVELEKLMEVSQESISWEVHHTLATVRTNLLNSQLDFCVRRGSTSDIEFAT
ncbi:MAG: hypothetical protein K0S02_1664 [Achromobacter mucicolens]|uniref:hypothetical protein n=1 Tax=Achromobacter mucicolens TaxID=1389922 RepID=UPI00242C7777|nr:hypothetical protein [Achromobacter mucicolens]MDF2861392.1 hypothetical protein [Achromobacter mucicolens]